MNGRILRERGDVLQAAEAHRKNGNRIGFTNGCFDLLHPGHVRLLNRTRRLCDVLFVGVNADESVRALKGEGRPILPLCDRMELLAALRCVSYVCPFPETSVERLVKDVNPDVLTKGGEYDEDGIVGAPFVLAQGGQVMRLRMVEGNSTAGLIERIGRLFLSGTL